MKCECACTASVSVHALADVPGPSLARIVASLHSPQGMAAGEAESGDGGPVHADFRLWLTCAFSSKLPASLVQMGLKVTLDPPTGVQSFMLAAYERFDFLSETSSSSYVSR